MRLPVLCALVALSFSCMGQQPKCKMSEAIDLPMLGWNKTLLMRNGNTILFHFEQRKNILVKLFDSTGKEIASNEETCGILDVRALERSELKGIYDIGGQATVFISQQVYNKECLIRLRYSAKTGKLMKEEIAVASKSFENSTETTVLKNEKTEGYNIVCFRKVDKIPDEHIQVVRYGPKDDTINISSVDAAKRAFKFIKYADASMDEQGNIGIGLVLTNVEVSGTTMLSSDLDQRYALCYLPANDTGFVITMAEIPQRLSPYYTRISYNSFSNNINCLFVNSLSGSVRNGIERKFVAGSIPCLMVLSGGDFSAVSQKLLNNDKAHDANPAMMDTNMKYKRPPLKMYTNDAGLTTIISEEQKQFYEKEGGNLWGYTRLGNICITQVDDNGEEVWGAVLPKNQYVHNYFNPFEIVNRDAFKLLFRHNPDQDYANQFASVMNYEYNNARFVLFNDSKDNYSKPLSASPDTVYAYEKTEAVYYKIDKKKNITKGWLFGEPGADESRSCMLESGDYDRTKNLYSCLALYRNGDKYTSHVIWSHLQ